MQDHTPHFPENITDYAPWVAQHGLLYPYGECQCGCGQKTKIAKKTRTNDGYKKNHPRRYLKAHGTVRPDTPEDFWGRVDRHSPNECWEWQDCRDNKGYGVFMHRGKKIRATHRAWELSNGPVPKGLWLLHKCDNPPCCNPSHLYLGTPANNVADRVARLGKTPGADVNAKLTVEQVKEIRSSYAQGNITKRELADKYGMSMGGIALVLNRKNWAHVHSRNSTCSIQ